MGRIAVGIEYDGTPFCGWQEQAGAPSVQGAVEAALARVADEPVSLICAGRTDSGVHARCQVAHFDTRASRRLRAWLLGTNTHLPPSIALRWVWPVPEHFHARYSAIARRYRYLILNRAARPALAHGRALAVHGRLDEQAMRTAGRHLVGEHDFSAFRAAQCQARSPVRRLDHIEVVRQGDWLHIDVEANAFLHHMVRNIVGLLLEVGHGAAPPLRAREQLASRTRSTGAATAPAHGLYLWRVHYAPEFGLPDDSAIIGPPGLPWI
ncbi:MAG: tRNA pseudouridine(38-40) synthase TruA [Gammaproteobacteria bacterium]|nr:tRNA pseudouridine(38-40) synthase TruA [Gammaproteobacteria bacterium]